MKALPGVRAVGAASGVPLNPEGQNLMPFEIEGGEHPEAKGVYAAFSSVTPAYFQAAGIPLRAGRAFTARDDAAAPLVVAINEVMARRFWPGARPVGRRLRMNLAGTSRSPTRSSASSARPGTAPSPRRPSRRSTSPSTRCRTAGWWSSRAPTATPGASPG